MVHTMKNDTEIFKNHTNGNHFGEFNELLLNIYLFFQCDLPFGKIWDL